MTATSFSPRWQRFVALGDSTTEGLEDGDDDSGYVGFADRLARYIADAQREPLLYANLGVRGRKAAEVLAEQLPAALELSPDLATVVVGINDVLRLNSDLQRTGRYIAAMFSALRASGATVATFTFRTSPRSCLSPGCYDLDYANSTTSFSTPLVSTMWLSRTCATTHSVQICPTGMTTDFMEAPVVTTSSPPPSPPDLA